MRFIGLDVHKDFCEVAVVEGDACWSGPRVRSTPEDLEVFGQSLGPEDHVVLEATGGALAITAGAHPKEIQELCGHASNGTTLNVYGHLFEGLQDRLAERLADTFRGSSAAPVRPERGPDVVDIRRAEEK